MSDAGHETVSRETVGPMQSAMCYAKCKAVGPGTQTVRISPSIPVILVHVRAAVQRADCRLTHVQYKLEAMVCANEPITVTSQDKRKSYLCLDGAEWCNVKTQHLKSAARGYVGYNSSVQ